MNIRNKFIQYFDYKLSREEEKKLMNKLFLDPEFSSNFNELKRTYNFIKHHLWSPLFQYKKDRQLRDLRLNQILEIEEDFQYYFIKNRLPSNSKELEFNRLVREITKGNVNSKYLIKRFKPYSIIGIAAGILLAVSILKFTAFNNRSLTDQLSSKQVYLKYYSPGRDKNLLNIGIGNKNFHIIMEDFRETNFDEATLKIQMIKVTSKNEDALNIIKGLIFFQRNENERAKEYFSNVTIKQNSKAKLSAEWYLAMTYLSEGDSVKALPYLIKLKESRLSYSNRAKAIIQNFNSK